MFIIKSYKLRKKIIFLILAIIWGIIILSPRLINNDEEVKAVDNKLQLKVIVIDPGHGGVDPGAVGKKSLEKDITLAISKKLTKILEQGGWYPVFLRNKDIGLYEDDSSTSIREKKRQDLKNRVKLTKEANGDIFVSIHINAHPSPKWHGAQTFYHSNCENSKKLAVSIQEELKLILDRGNKRVAKSADGYFLLNELKKEGIPASIVEVGFISNPEEETLLNDPDYQDKIAWGIYMGILRYLVL